MRKDTRIGVVGPKVTGLDGKPQSPCRELTLYQRWWKKLLLWPLDRMIYKVTLHSVIPSDTDSLMSLPGVGRKTANVIASVVYNRPVIAVDTHVFRVARRIGLSDGKTVEAVEQDLTDNFPPELRPSAHHWLILHGRHVCTARKPHCDGCGIREWCREYGTTGSGSAQPAGQGSRQ